MSNLFLVASAAIIFLVLKGKGYRTSDSLAIGFASTLVLGSFLWALGIIQGHIITLYVVGTIASVLWCFFDRN